MVQQNKHDSVYTQPRSQSLSSSHPQKTREVGVHKDSFTTVVNARALLILSAWRRLIAKESLFPTRAEKKETNKQTVGGREAV